MIICHSRRFIFFSNPKTGSESFRRMLEPWSEEPIVSYRGRTADRPFYSHMSPEEAEQAFDARGLAFRDYRRITTVRNPYARLVSLYRMIREVDGVWRLRQKAGLSVPGFAAWLRSSRPDGRGGGGRPHQRWRRFGTWTAANWCAGRIDHVIRIEHAAEELPPLLSALGVLPDSLPHVNARPETNLAEWYDKALSDLVASRYRNDLARFGYAPLQLEGACHA